MVAAKICSAPLSIHSEPQNDEYFYCLNYTTTSIVIIRSTELTAIFYSHHWNGGGGFHFTLSSSAIFIALNWICSQLGELPQKNCCCHSSDILRSWRISREFILIWFPFLFVSIHRLFYFLIYIWNSSNYSPVRCVISITWLSQKFAKIARINSWNCLKLNSVFVDWERLCN